MSEPDPSILRALEAALESDPTNVAIRVHLAQLLLPASPAAALEQVETVLRTQPDHQDALSLAAEAARRLGDDARAESWLRLHDALYGARPGTEPGPLQPDGPRTTFDGQERQLGPTSGAVDWDAEFRDLFAEEARRQITLENVAGLKEVKERLESSFLGPMRNPDLRKAYGASMRGGLLLWGPPGCGKTFLARAVAGELGARFVSVGLHDVLDMWLGNSEKHLHELFEVARRRGPTVLFFDEVDAIGHARSDLGRSAGRNVVAQLLAEMDGVDSTNDGVFVIGATNQPWDVDPALRRPGRLDRSMLVLPPDAAARAAILELHLRDRPWSSEPVTAVVTATEGFSGADMKLVCDDAAHSAMAEAARLATVRPITAADLVAAAQHLRPSTPPWFELARNFATYANATGEYDELATYLKSQGRSRR